MRRVIHDFEETSFRVEEGAVEVDETYFDPSFGNRRRAERRKLRKAGKIRRDLAARELKQPVFYIYKRTDGLVYVDLVADVSGAELKEVLRENLSIETTIYSDSFSSYRGLQQEFAGHEIVSHQEGEYARATATISGIEGFWAYAKERLLRPHRVADDHFLLHLKEVEYRFNHRELEPEEFVNHLLSEVLLV